MSHVEISTNLEASGDLARLGVKSVGNLIVGVWNWDQPTNDGMFDGTNRLFGRTMAAQRTSLTLAGVDLEHSVRRIGWTGLQQLEIASGIQYSTLVQLVERLPTLAKLQALIQFDEPRLSSMLQFDGLARDDEKHQESPVKALRSRLRHLQIKRVDGGDRPAVVRAAVWRLLVRLPTLEELSTDMRRVLQLPKLVREYGGVYAHLRELRIRGIR
ncbi:hypothetical protein LPJ53_004346 [Coemansia erecta]|uniref:Uncharacterized protein n=1 Tax=Coemansia erecta TaxID=147472 RepID=A0A9W7XZA4_9FUNG|nr:hypothetical protein LPJ53_004346 [Coemansia erecta]